MALIYCSCLQGCTDRYVPEDGLNNEWCLECGGPLIPKKEPEEISGENNGKNLVSEYDGVSQEKAEKEKY